MPGAQLSVRHTTSPWAFVKNHRPDAWISKSSKSPNSTWRQLPTLVPEGMCLGMAPSPGCPGPPSSSRRSTDTGTHDTGGLWLLVRTSKSGRQGPMLGQRVDPGLWLSISFWEISQFHKMRGRGFGRCSHLLLSLVQSSHEAGTQRAQSWAKKGLGRPAMGTFVGERQLAPEKTVTFSAARREERGLGGGLGRRTG